MKKYFLAFVILLSFSADGAPLPSQKGQVVLPSKESSVEFVAIGRPTALKIRGKGGIPEGSFFIQKNEVTGSVEVILENFDTGIGLRNEHMRKKYLEIEKFPKAKLEVKKMILPPSFWREENTSFKEVAYEGVLSLHGVSRSVQGVFELEKRADHISVQASFTLKLSDFGIMTPNFKGITVAQDVQVIVSFLAPLKKI
ncbi:MAG: YceI family protein [Deltaproteobacteria bacterium]|nr:YceI family protein [Deltaproteobacteria bacterium]